MTTLFDSAIGNIINVRPKRFRALSSRPGVFPYLINGRLRWQYRPEEEVYNQDSVDSLLDAVLTLGHPDNDLDIEEIHGAICGVETVEPEGIYSDIIVLTDRALTLAKANSPVSPMYDVTIVESNGEWNGQKYDLVQRNIRYRSLGLVDKARLGDSVKIFLQLSKDSGEAIAPDTAHAIAESHSDTEMIATPFIQQINETKEMSKKPVETVITDSAVASAAPILPPPLTLPTIEANKDEEEEVFIPDQIEPHVAEPKKEAIEPPAKKNGGSIIAEFNTLGGVNINRDYLNDAVEIATRADSMGIMGFNEALQHAISAPQPLIRHFLAKTGIQIEDHDDAMVAYKVYSKLNPMPTSAAVANDSAEVTDPVTQEVVGDSSKRAVAPFVPKIEINHPLHKKPLASASTQAKKIVTFDMLEDRRFN